MRGKGSIRDDINECFLKKMMQEMSAHIVKRSHSNPRLTEPPKIRHNKRRAEKCFLRYFIIAV